MRNKDHSPSGAGKQFTSKSEAIEFYTKGYIKELEKELDSQSRITGAWKVRYYVELFRLIAARNHNKRIREQVTKQIGEIQSLEQHALDLSKQNATLLANADVEAHAKEVETLKAEVNGLKIQLKSKEERFSSEKDSWEEMIRTQKETYDAELKAMREDVAEEVKMLKEGHNQHTRELEDVHKSTRSRHEEEVQQMKEDLEKEKHAFFNAKEIKDNRLKAAKYDLQEKICQDLVLKIKGMEAEVQKKIAACAEAESNVQVMSRQIGELEEELAASEELSATRQETLDDLSEKLEQELETRKHLESKLDPQFIELLKSQLEEAVTTRDVTTQLNLESQLKIQGLERQLDEVSTKHKVHAEDSEKRFTALLGKYEALEYRAQNGELTSENAVDKLKEEMGRVAGLKEENILQKRDIHILETELESVRVNLKVAVKEANASRTDKHAAEQERDAAQIENKTLKSQVHELQVQSAADRIASEEFKKIKEMTEDEVNSRLAEALARSNERVNEVMKKGATAMEEASEKYRVAMDAAEERVERARVELAVATEKSVEQINTIDRLEKKLRRTAKRLQEMEGSDYETDTDHEPDTEDEDLPSSSSEEDEDGEYDVNRHATKVALKMTARRKTKRRRLKAGRNPKRGETNTEDLQRIISTLETKMQSMLDSHSSPVAAVTSPFISSAIGGASALEENSLVIMRQRLLEAEERIEQRGMYIADVERRLEMVHDEYTHSVEYSRYLEGELFNARKKEVQMSHGKPADHKRTGVPVIVGQGRAVTAAGKGNKSQADLVQGVSLIGGEVAGKSLGAFLGATTYDENTNPFNDVTKVYLNHGGEIGLDGKQDIHPWSFNPLLSSTGADQSQRYESRHAVAVLRGELETQAYQLQCYLEDTVSVALFEKMRSRMGLQDWVQSFIKINDRNPLEADKVRSPKFTVLAEEYIQKQRELERALEEFHEPAYIAEQKRVEYEDACEEIYHHTGHRPPYFECSFTLRSDLAWAAMENPLAVTEKFPDWWFPSLVNTDLLKYVSNGDVGDEDGVHGSEITHPQLGVVTGPDEESLKKFAEYEGQVQHLQADVTQLLQEKEHYLTLIDHLQLQKSSSSKKVGKKKKGSSVGEGSTDLTESMLSSGAHGPISRMSSTSSIGSSSVTSKGKKKKKKKKKVKKIA